MTRPQPLVDANRHWEQLLALGEQLVRQPLANQSDLIEATANRLLSAQTTLYLVGNAFDIPGVKQTLEYTHQIPALPQTAIHARSVIPADGETNEIAVPLIAQDVLLGVLHCRREPDHPFTTAERRTAEQFAGYVATTLQVNRQAAIKNWRLEQLNLVRSVNAQITNLRHLDQLAEEVTRLIQETFHFYYVAIFTLEPNRERLVFRANATKFTGEPSRNPMQEVEVHLGEGLVGTAAKLGEEIYAPDVLADPRYRHIDGLPETRSEIAIPLKVNDRVLGVLDAQSDELHGFHDIDLLVLRSLADGIATAVEGARLYQGLRYRAEQMAAISEVSQAIASILDLDALLDAVVDVVHKRFGFPFVHLFTVHQGRRKIIYRAGSGERSQVHRLQGLAYDLDDPTGIIPWVARNGQTYLAEQVDQDPLYRPSELQPHNTQAELAVPLVFGNEVLGVLDVQSNLPSGFFEEDLALFESLAGSIATAIRNATLFRSEAWRRQVSDSLRDVAGLISADTPLNNVLETILQEMERNLACHASAIWLLDECPDDTSELCLVAARGASNDALEAVWKTKRKPGNLLRQALDASQPLIRNPHDPPGPLGKALDLPADYSALAIPLRSSNRRLGVMVLVDHLPNRYGREAASLATTFASYAAVAIENNRLFTSAQEQAWISTVMLQVAEAVQSLTTVEELVETLVRLTPMLAGIHSCALLLWDANRRLFQLAAEYGLSPAAAAAAAQPGLSLDNMPLFATACETGAPQLATTGYPALFPNLPAPRSGSAPLGLCILPIAAHGTLLGIMLVERSIPADLDGDLNDHQQAILQGITRQTATAIESLRLLEGKQAEAYVTAVLLQVAQTVVSQNNLDDILEAIVHIMPILVGIDSCMIYLWEADRRQFRPAQAYLGTWQEDYLEVNRLFRSGEFPLLDHALLATQPVVLPFGEQPPRPAEWRHLPLDGAEPALAPTQHLLIGLPLSARGMLLGVLLAQDVDQTGELRERRLEIITGIAQQAALAIQNERLHQETVERERLQREVQLAREIQRTFLPDQLPAQPGWQLDVRWRTARQVGGDFYDCFDLPGDRLGLVVADVSDKGMPAALYMTVTRTLLRAAARETASPAEVLKRVNDLLLADTEGGMFVTAVYAVLSPATGQLIYANAGHNLPVWYHAGKIETLARGNVALGVWEEASYTDHHIQLEPGDLLLCYTDGVTDATNPEGEFFGDVRLLEAIRLAAAQVARPGDAPGLLNAVEAAIVEFQGLSAADDDITMLAIGRAAQPADMVGQTPEMDRNPL